MARLIQLAETLLLEHGRVAETIQMYTQCHRYMLKIVLVLAIDASRLTNCIVTFLTSSDKMGCACWGKTTLSVSQIMDVIEHSDFALGIDGRRPLLSLKVRIIQTLRPCGKVTMSGF